MRIAEQSPHTAPNLSMKKSKVSVSTAQWCLVWVRKIDELDPTVAFLLPALGMASSGLALRFLKELSCDSLGMEQRKKNTSRTSVEGLRELHGTYKNPFVVQLGPQPPAHLDEGLWAWQTSCWKDIPKPWGFQKRSR